MQLFDNCFNPILDFFDIFCGHFGRLVEKTQAVIRAFTAGTDKNTILIKIAADTHGIHAEAGILRFDDFIDNFVHGIKIFFAGVTADIHKDCAALHCMGII